MKKLFKNKIFIGIILCIISCGIGVYGASKYNANGILYNGSDGTSESVKEALDELYAKTECEKDSFCSKVKIGDYIKMTPTKTTYTVNSTKTGWKESSDYSSDDVINPSELNLWRVIKKNDNGTIEMVSEYVSSTNVTFYGQTGYLNFVGALNEISSQYENSSYTIGSRIMGYNGQTEYITNTSKFTTTAPWTNDTKDNSNETLGGGDVMFKDDYGMVYDALEILKGTTPSGTATSYWLGSRRYYYNSSTSYYWYGRLVHSSGSIYDNSLYSYISGWNSRTYSYAIRPILTLKSGLKATGSGTSTNPWVLQ